jgi:predicted MPP superfamily phosphohydrolase
MLTRFLIVTVIWLLIDLYVFQAVKTVVSGMNSTSSSIILWAYWVVDITLILIILYLGATGKFAHGPNKNFNWIMGGMIIILVPKLVVTPFLLIEDIARFVQGTYSFVVTKMNGITKQGNFLPERRKFVSIVGLSIASIPFIGTLYGVVKGKYDYRVHRVKLAFKDLPEAFHGFTITQLSDIHSGSFDDPIAVQRGIDIAKSQKSDLMVFTGDLVNNHAEEMNDWIEHFSQLTAPYGSYSILGNHDYGDYIPWPTEEAKEKNLENLKKVHEKIGFKLLLNEHLHIEKDGEKMALIGVENWGKKGFVKHGDLNKATENLEDDLFKILLSHDPSHWDTVTLDHDKHIHLTLSGHTHGMQFGIEIPGFKWSPSKYIYPQWAGAYEKKGKYIYVNRGFGFLGFPGRVGIMPEITVIELVKA